MLIISTARKRSLGQGYFYLSVSHSVQGALGRYPPRDQYTPRTRYTPLDQVHPARDQVHPLARPRDQVIGTPLPREQCMLGDTGAILLEYLFLMLFMPSSLDLNRNFVRACSHRAKANAKKINEYAQQITKKKCKHQRKVSRFAFAFSSYEWTFSL